MTTPQFAVLAFILMTLVMVNVLALVFHLNLRQNLRPFRPASLPSHPKVPAPAARPGGAQGSPGRPPATPLPKAA